MNLSNAVVSREKKMARSLQVRKSERIIKKKWRTFLNQKTCEETTVVIILPHVH